MLTTDTSEAIVLTLRGIVSLVKTLLQHGFSYGMLGQIQSVRIDGEFGIYREQSRRQLLYINRQIVQKTGLRPI